jgi:two-component system LytT family response regulator
LNSDRITIPHLEGLKIIEFAEIVYLEADSNYTIFHLMNAQKFVSSKTMGEFEPLLTAHFFRIHKSFVINLNHVAEYSKKNGNNVIMKEGSILPIARRRFQEFMYVLSNG